MILIFIERVGGFHSWFMLNGNLRGGFLRPLIGGGVRRENRAPQPAQQEPREGGRPQQRGGQAPAGGWWGSFRFLGARRQNPAPLRQPAADQTEGAELRAQQRQTLVNAEVCPQQRGNTM